MDLKKEEYERLSEAAKAAGKSINGYIKEAIEEKISHGNGAAERIPSVFQDFI